MFLGYKIDLRIGGMKYGWNFEIYLTNYYFFLFFQIVALLRTLSFITDPKSLTDFMNSSLVEKYGLNLNYMKIINFRILHIVNFQITIHFNQYSLKL